MSKLDRARQSLATLLETAQIDVGHGIDHAEIVLENANKALEYKDIPEPNQEAIRLAAVSIITITSRIKSREYNIILSITTDQDKR